MVKVTEAAIAQIKKEIQSMDVEEEIKPIIRFSMGIG